MNEAIIFDKNKKIHIIEISKFQKYCYMDFLKKYGTSKWGQTLDKHLKKMTGRWTEYAINQNIKKFKKFLEKQLENKIKKEAEKIIIYKKTKYQKITKTDPPDHIPRYGEINEFIKSKILEIFYNSNNCLFIKYSTKQNFINNSQEIKNFLGTNDIEKALDAIWNNLLK